MLWRNTIFEKYCMTGRVQEELSCQCNGYPAADDLDVLINSKCTPQVAIREVSKKLILSMAWLSPSSGRTSYRASKLKSGQKARPHRPLWVSSQISTQRVSPLSQLFNLHVIYPETSDFDFHKLSSHSIIWPHLTQDQDPRNTLFLLLLLIIIIEHHRS